MAEDFMVGSKCLIQSKIWLHPIELQATHHVQREEASELQTELLNISRDCNWDQGVVDDKLQRVDHPPQELQGLSYQDVEDERKSEGSSQGSVDDCGSALDELSVLSGPDLAGNPSQELIILG